MKIISNLTRLFLLEVIILTVISSYVFAQETGGPPPPPIDVKITAENIPQVGEEVKLKIEVIPQEDMHIDIRCLLPEGIRLVEKKGFMVRPCIGRERYRKETQTRYREAVGLWVGPLEGGITREFVFRVMIPDKKRYPFVVCVDALARWGSKEEILIIDIE